MSKNGHFCQNRSFLLKNENWPRFYLTEVFALAEIRRLREALTAFAVRLISEDIPACESTCCWPAAALRGQIASPRENDATYSTHASSTIG